MKKNKLTASILILMTGLTCSNLALAKEENTLLTFSKPNAYESVTESIDSLSVWAKSEYLEHESEGLFEKHPNDGNVIKETLSLTKELKKLAAKAKADGNYAKAKAYLFSAEATANYAASMPHMLEDRLEKQAKVAAHD